MSTADNRIHTHSKLRAWWLRKLGGYCIKKVTERPRLTVFGHLKYEETYTLGLPGEDDPPSTIGFDG
jgi:hypothetical protein